MHKVPSLLGKLLSIKKAKFWIAKEKDGRDYVVNKEGQKGEECWHIVDIGILKRYIGTSCAFYFESEILNGTVVTKLKL